jgi:hypothetical protein
LRIKRDVFVFSVSSYGYYDESHISLKVCDDYLRDSKGRHLPREPEEGKKETGSEKIDYSTSQLRFSNILFQKLYVQRLRQRNSAGNTIRLIHISESGENVGFLGI